MYVMYNQRISVILKDKGVMTPVWFLWELVALC